MGNQNRKLKKISAFRRIFSIILFVILLPILLVFGLFWFSYKFDKKRKFLNSDKKGKFLIMKTDITKIDIMEGYEFEELLKAIFFYLGYKVDVTKKSRDYGADLILSDDNNSLIVVQAKRYNKSVGAKSVQEINAAKIHYKANEAWVVTNSNFTQAAEVLARETDVKLIDRDELIELFAEAKTKIGINEDIKEKENFGSTSFDGFGQGEFRI